MQAAGSSINSNTVGRAARVSKTFLYDPKQAHIAEQIRSLRQVHPESQRKAAGTSKSDSATEVQIARFKARIKTLEERIQALQEQNELLYGRLVRTKVIRRMSGRKTCRTRRALNIDRKLWCATDLNEPLAVTLHLAIVTEPCQSVAQNSRGVRICRFDYAVVHPGSLSPRSDDSRLAKIR